MNITEDTISPITAKSYADHVINSHIPHKVDRTILINKMHFVSNLLSLATGGQDKDLIDAGYLHLLTESCGSDIDEMRQLFGEDVAKLISEITDSPFLKKEVRKSFQFENAKNLSDRGKLLRLAEKIATIEDKLTRIPAGWDHAKCVECLIWAVMVSEECLGLNNYLDTYFKKLYREATETFKLTSCPA